MDDGSMGTTSGRHNFPYFFFILSKQDLAKVTHFKAETEIENALCLCGKLLLW